MSRPSHNCDERLIQAGLRILAEEESADFSVRKVCARAGVNLGMFTYHFGKKENFQKQVLDAAADALFADFSSASSNGDGADPLDQLVIVLTHLLDRIEVHRDLARAFFNEAMKGSPLAAKIASGQLPRHVRVLLELLEECRQSGAINSKIDPRQALTVIFGAVVLPLLYSGSFLGCIDPNHNLPGAHKKGELSRNRDVVEARLRLGILLEGMRPRSEGGGPLPAIKRLASRVGLISDDGSDISLDLNPKSRGTPG